MRRAPCAAAVALLALALAAEAMAAPPTPPPTPAEAAAAVAKAWSEKAEDEVKRLAEQDDPDPWLVADALLVQGAREAAQAFAKAAPRKDVERLPDFVAKWSATEADQAARSTIAKVNAALTEKRPADAVAAFADAPAAAMPYLKARLRDGQGLALLALGKHAEAAERFQSVAAEFEALGWLARAARSLLNCAQAQADAQQAPAAFETLKRLVALETARRAPSVGLAQAHRATGLVHAQGGQWEEARAAHTRALEIYQEMQDRPRIAGALNDLAYVEVQSQRPEEAMKAAERALVISELAGLSAETARSNEIMGNAYHDQGRLDMASDRYADAVPHAHEAGDALAEARLLFLQGRTLGELEEHARAVEVLRQCLKANEALGPDRAAATTLARARLAWSLASAGSLNEARPEADRAVADSASSGNPYVKGFALWAAGTLLRKEGKADEAVKALTTAIENLESARAGEGAVLALTEVSEARRAQGSLPEARKAADLALERAKRLKGPYAIAVATAAAARVRKDQGEAKDALGLARQAFLAYQGMRHANGANAIGVLVRELEEAAPR